MKQTKHFKRTAFNLSAKSMLSTLLLLIAMLLPQGAWAISGSGTSSSPYLIANEADLRTFQQYVENGNSGIYGKLTADITLTSAWTRIGRADRKFTGYFDGQGHTISGMNLSFTAYEHGFFGFVNNATIKNFTLTGTMTSSANGNHSHGTVVGSAAGTTVIENVTSSVNLTLNHTGFTCIGGIVGHMDESSKVIGCTYTGTINLNKDSEQVGGIVGYAQRNLYITDNVFSGTITSTGTCKYLAGIAGKTDGTIEVSGCTNIGTINGGPSYDCVAGIVGYVQYQSQALITNCYFGGSLSSTSSGTSLGMGGILGAVNDDAGTNFRGLTYCFSDGTLTATNSSSTQIGGIAGVIKSKAVSKVMNNTYLSGKASQLAAISNNSSTFDSSNKAITISVSAGTGGNVSKSYVYPTSTTATKLQVEATPNSGYHYVKWSDNGAQTHNVSLANNVSLTANFGAHNYGNWQTDKDASCTSDGTKHRVCTHTGCGAREDVTIDALGHSLTATVATNATCTTAGNNKYWTCSTCKKVFSDEKATTETTVAAQTIKAKGHSLTATAANAATCTTAGNKAYWTCSKCNKVFSNSTATTETTVAAQTIKAAGHSLTATPAKAETCTEAGNNAYWTCSKCNKVFSNSTATTETTVAAQTIKALSHDHSSKTTTETYRKDAATCTTAATYWYKCSRCNDKSTTSFYTSTDDKDKALNHIMTEHAAHDATCTEDGNLLYYTCSQPCCSGKYYEDNLAHTTNTYENQAATVITALAHTYVDGHCSVCGDDYAPLTVTLGNGEVRKYNSLQYAIYDIVSTVWNGAILTLHQDLTLEGYESIEIINGEVDDDFNFTLDLNGHTITGGCEDNPKSFLIANSKSGLLTLTIANNCQDKKGKLFNCCLDLHENTKVIVREGVSIYPRFENLGFAPSVVNFHSETSSLENYGDLYGNVPVDRGASFINNGRVAYVYGEFENHGGYCAYFNWADDGSSFSAYVDGSIYDYNEEDEEITSEVTKEPTCSEPGVRTFTGTFIHNFRFGPQEFTDTKEVEIPALGGHTFAANDLTHDVCTVCNHGFLRYEAGSQQDPYKAENLKDEGSNTLTIESHTFSDGQGVMEFNAPLVEIGYRAFLGKGIERITIPNTVTTIGEDAFVSAGLTSIDIPNSVETIGYSAFFNCINLQTITLGTSVEEIGYDAFGYVGSSAKITLKSLPQFTGQDGYASTFYNATLEGEDEPTYEDSTDGSTTEDTTTEDTGSMDGSMGESMPVKGESVRAVKRRIIEEVKTTIPATIEIDDNSYISEGFACNYVNTFSYTRNIKNEWGTIVMPFDLMNCDDYDLYTLKDCTGSELILEKKIGNLPANTPALIRIKNGLVGDGKTHNLTFHTEPNLPVNLNQHIDTQLVGSLTFTGSYSVKDITYEYGYVISNNKFWHIGAFGGSVYCAPFRAYLTGNISGVKQLNISISEDTDAMEALNAITNDDAEYYDLNGRRIPSLQRGVNIVKYGNGKTKKVTIK